MSRACDSYAVGDSLGVYAVNSDYVGRRLAGRHRADRHGNRSTSTAPRSSLREALTSSYDICRVTPNLLTFVAEHCGDQAAAKMLRGTPRELDKWLVDRNGLDIVLEFAVRAESELWQEVLVRLTPRQYSISSSPLGEPARGAADGVGGPVPGHRRRPARRGGLDVPGGSRRR